MQNQKTKGITAWIVTVVTVIVLLFSAFYLVEHAEHDCTGSECPICMVMAQCSNNLKAIGTALILASASLFLFTLTNKELHYDKIISLSNSLISQKVRMNN